MKVLVYKRLYKETKFYRKPVNKSSRSLVFEIREYITKRKKKKRMLDEEYITN